MYVSRMGDEDFSTSLAYTKNPKASKRTNFQDELEAAVNARASRHIHTDTYSDDFDEVDDDDDFLQDLLKTRRRNMDLNKALRTKPQISRFRLSDDEEENLKPKKVSFLKSTRREQIDQQQVESCRSQSEASTWRKSLFESPVPLNSENSQWESSSRFDSSLSLPSESGQETFRRVLSSDRAPVPSHRLRSPSNLTGDIPPRPVPRQRVPNTNSSGYEEEGGPESSVSVPLSSTGRCSTVSVSSLRTGTSETDAVQDSEQQHTPAMTSTHSGSLGGTASTEQNRTEEESHESCQEHEDLVDGAESRIKSQPRPSGSRPASSSRSRRACSYRAQSRYLGTLKVLDQTSVRQEAEPNGADSLRAAVYQEWLKKKEEKLQEILRDKKQEQKRKQEKKHEDEVSKKAEAKASYEAWKEKKQESTREKIKEKQESMRKQHKEQEEREERKQSAKRVFEKWKQEHDVMLREQHRKKIQSEKKLNERKEREQDERKRESSSAFRQWSERKKSVIQEKVKDERRMKEVREMEEQYVKEEREKEALETYDRWLIKKEVQQRRERKAKPITTEDLPPPPWSPPNRTISFGK